MSIVIKTINQIATFALEITMFIAYGYYGLNRTWSLTYRILFTTLIISTAIALWAIFAAPKAGHRLEMPYLAIFRAGMFFIAAFFLFQSGYKNIAVILAGFIIITQIVSYFAEK